MLSLSRLNVLLYTVTVAPKATAVQVYGTYCDGCLSGPSAEWRWEDWAALLLVHHADRTEILKYCSLWTVGQADGHRQPRLTSCTVIQPQRSDRTTVPRSLRSLLCRPQTLKASANNGPLLNTADSSDSNQDVGCSNTPSLTKPPHPPSAPITIPPPVWWSFSRQAQREAVTSDE